MKLVGSPAGELRHTEAPPQLRIVLIIRKYQLLFNSPTDVWSLWRPQAVKVFSRQDIFPKIFFNNIAFIVIKNFKKLLSAGVNIFSQQYCIDNTVYTHLLPDDICAGVPATQTSTGAAGGIDTCQVKFIYWTKKNCENFFFFQKNLIRYSNLI